MDSQDSLKVYRKLYYKLHKPYLLEYRKQRYEAKKHIINRKIECPVCGRNVIERMYKKHILTDIHKKGKKNKKTQLEMKPIATQVYHNGWVEFK